MEAPRNFFLLSVAAFVACAGPVPAPGPAAPAARPATPVAAAAAETRSPGAASGGVYVPELLSAGLADPQAYELLSELCTRAPRRISGSEAAARAVDWGRKTMLRLGLENVRVEECKVPHWERGTIAECLVVEPAAHAGERLPILALGGSVATPESGLQGEVIAVESFEELQARAAEARGKLVLFSRPMDPTKLDPFEAYGGAVNQRSSGASEAARAGALAALVRSMTLSQDDEPHTGAMNYAEGVERVPAAAMSTNACARLRDWLASGERVVLRLTLDCRTGEDVLSHNVVGEVVGKERPGEIVLIGGHLDSWDVGQGAQDDGSGCAHVLEAGRLLLGSPLGRPRRTVRCVLFMNEENGLRGAQAYRDAHHDELERHVLAIESDRGGGLPLGYATDATGEALATLTRIFGGAPCARGGGADISPMAEFRVPMAGLYPNPERYFDFHHSERDLLASVHPRELELGAISLASLAWLAANLEGEWPRNPPRESASW